ncbi:MAG: hydrogenase formation protein HypD [Bacteroidales bacterium]|nr:hydrogenase formation protein HypD [Bacteroidales bacterium]
MRYIDEFRNSALVKILAENIRKLSHKPVRIMEVCGGHTMAIHRFGIPSLLPATIELLSGPGCPVCVTSRSFIDTAVAMCRLPDVILTTYGDLIRVPGSSSTLEREKAAGYDVQVVYSTLDALEIAQNNPDKKIVFPGIGFETTTPSSAVAILEALRQKIPNFHLLSSHKTMPRAMMALIDAGIKIDGYIGPGHVSTVAGADMYATLLKKHPISIVISGFEPVDLLQSIYLIVQQVERGERKLEIQYTRVVTPEGNQKAKSLVDTVFESCDDWWRGLGVIPGSGMAIRKEFSAFDAYKQLPVTVEPVKEPPECLCGEVLKGLKKPVECKLFGKACTPVNPIGACMVSNEGACQAYYKYS